VQQQQQPPKTVRFQHSQVWQLQQQQQQTHSQPQLVLPAAAAKAGHAAKGVAAAIALPTSSSRQLKRRQHLTALA
jgi:hypothetical protein